MPALAIPCPLPSAVSFRPRAALVGSNLLLVIFGRLVRVAERLQIVNSGFLCFFNADAARTVKVVAWDKAGVSDGMTN